MRLTAEAEVLDERRVVADVVRHDDAPLGRGRTQQFMVRLTLEIWALLLHSDRIDAAAAELLGDGMVEVLVEEEPQPPTTRRRVCASRRSSTRL